MSTRYYFHGDQSEDNADSYFCARCDLFMPASHFFDPPHRRTNKEKYGRSLRAWINVRQNSRGCLARPDNAPNLFANTATPSRFYRWLMKQRRRDDPIGDLSRDAGSDHNFPVRTSSLDILRARLLTKQACSEAIQALHEAFEEFKRKTTARDGLSPSLRFDIFRRDQYRCQICGAKASDGTRLEVDHKVAVANGGTNEPDNLWTLCFKCNRGKGTKTI